MSAESKLSRQTDIAENKNKEQIDQQKGTASVAAQFVGKAPDIGHAYGRADGGKDEAPTAGKILRIVFSFHFSPISLKQAFSYDSITINHDSKQSFQFKVLLRQSQQQAGECIAGHEGGKKSKSKRFF